MKEDIIHDISAFQYSLRIDPIFLPQKGAINHKKEAMKKRRNFQFSVGSRELENNRNISIFFRAFLCLFVARIVCATLLQIRMKGLPCAPAGNLSL